MKILQITPSYKPAYVYGGPTVSVSLLCEQLTQAGQDVLVLTTTANGPGELPVTPNRITKIDGVKVIYFKRWTKDHTHFSPGLIRYLWKNVKEHDIIHIHSWWNLVATFAVLICYLRGIKPVLSPRGMLSAYSFQNQHSKIKKLLHRFLFGPLLHHTFYHATSKRESEDYLAISKKWPGSIVPNFLPIKAKSIRERTENQDFKFILLCRIHPIKNIETVFRCLAKLSFPYELTVVGSGDKKYIDQLKTTAKELGIQEKVIWKGRVIGKEKNRLLIEADLLILLSYYESFANVIIEALCCGTAVLVAETVGVVDFVKAHDLGWTTSLADKEIYDKIEKAYNDKSKRKSIRQLAPAIVQEHFSGIALSMKYQEMYQKNLAPYIHEHVSS